MEPKKIKNFELHPFADLVNFTANKNWSAIDFRRCTTYLMQNWSLRNSRGDNCQKTKGIDPDLHKLL